MSGRELIRSLVVRRVADGLTTADLAARMNWTPHDVEVMESMADANLVLGNIAKYADGLGLRVRVVFEPKEGSNG